MAKRILRRRGTTLQTSTFIGGEGELTVDTDKKTVVVHDGLLAGGYPLQRAPQNWVSSRVYNVGTEVISPSSLFKYSRIATGAGTIDPSLDQNNWLQVTGVSISGLISFMASSF